MPNFRSIAFLALAALSLALAAPLVPTLAQAPAQMMHGPRSGQMPNPLGITDAQKARMQPILMSARQQAAALQANAALSPAVRMAKMQALQKSVGVQMMALLTPAQHAKMKAMIQARASSHAGGGFGGPHP